MSMNPSGNRLPSYQQDKADIWVEFRKLWKKVSNVKLADPDIREIVWGWGGELDGDTTAGAPWQPPFGIIITSVNLSLGVAGAGASSFGLYIDGGLHSTYSIASGATYVSYPVSIGIQTTQAIHVAQVSFTAPAENAGVIVRYVKAVQVSGAFGGS